MPAAGFLLALFLLSGVQFGSWLADNSNIQAGLASFSPEVNLTPDQYSPLTNIPLPASVSFLPNIYNNTTDWFSAFVNWIKDLWATIVIKWSQFLGLAPTTPATPDLANLREQIKQEVLDELSRQASSTSADASDLKISQSRLAAFPSTGSTTQDQITENNLRQAFADPVDVQVDPSGTAGVVRPIFRDGRRGGNYVFVLTPAK